MIPLNRKAGHMIPTCTWMSLSRCCCKAVTMVKRSLSIPSNGFLVSLGMPLGKSKNSTMGLYGSALRFLARVSPCSPGWPGTESSSHANDSPSGKRLCKVAEKTSETISVHKGPLIAEQTQVMPGAGRSQKLLPG